MKQEFLISKQFASNVNLIVFNKFHQAKRERHSLKALPAKLLGKLQVLRLTVILR